MFNPTSIVIEAFIKKLSSVYRKTYGVKEPDFPSIIEFIGRMTLENLSNGDAPYHDVYHTMAVTSVGQEILWGKHCIEGGVTTHDWLNVTVSLLCHDIGYLRGICSGDKDGQYVINDKGETIGLKPGATDASLTPYHVNRSKIFVKERFTGVSSIDVDQLQRNIEQTRFPIPEGETYIEYTDYPGLVRAADLIGQMADLNYSRKSAALYVEFQEDGTAEKMGYQNAADLRSGYPSFFWNVIHPLIPEALRFLRVTQEGKQWVANLYANVFAEEHKAPTLGVERNCPDAI
ncbi:MAG TPA: metal-dependent phosphohydrolase [Verrucomicrobia bacterium]|nr:metal-dependent phosphohydrolase [Verrucomicrobiota bacterium]